MAKKQKSLFSPQMRECMNPHTVLHSTFGLGIGLMIPTLLTGVPSQTIFTLGIVFAVIGVFGELFLKK